MATTLIVPGLNSSGPAHWQSWFEERIPGSLRVVQSDWKDANLPEWSARVRRDIARTPGRHFIVAHSFGVLAAVQAAVDHADRIAGALLVAPADPAMFKVEAYLPQTTLPFPSVVVGSSNDAWMTLARAADWADTWGADFVNFGAAGHINTEAGFGPWPEGLALLQRLKRAVSHHHAQAVPRTGLVSAVGRRTRARTSTTSWSARQRQSATGTLWQAAHLLEEAGWQVRPPQPLTHVARV